MIQAEIGGGARIDPGTGVQRPGFMIRTFTLPSSDGNPVPIDRFRGHVNLVVVFPGYSDAMRAFIDDAIRQGRGFSEQNATLVVIVPYEPYMGAMQSANDAPVVTLHDGTHAIYKLCGAMGEDGRPVPLVYVTDRFGEIVSTYIAPDHSMPPKIDEVLHTLEFVNHQCPECEPPEWPREEND